MVRRRGETGRSCTISRLVARRSYPSRDVLGVCYELPVIFCLPAQPRRLCVFPLSCYWPKASNAGGLGAEPPGETEARPALQMGCGRHTVAAIIGRMQTAERQAGETVFIRFRVAAARGPKRDESRLGAPYSLCRWFCACEEAIGKLRRLRLPLPPGRRPAKSATVCRPHPAGGGRGNRIYTCARG